MTRKPLYDGQIQAHVVGAFIRLGQGFTVIHPGYDSQGRRREQWTQVVYKGVPVWEWRLSAPVDHVVSMFDRDVKQYIGRSKVLMQKSLDACVTHRRQCFKDGRTGTKPAPSLAGGRGHGREYAT